jgi:hypothetical protein
MAENLNVGVIFQGDPLQAARFTARIENLIASEGLRLIYVKKARRTLTIFSPDDDIQNGVGP